MKKFILALPLMATSIFYISTSVHAEDYACVNIKVGAGFTAKMRVTSASYTSDWSGKYNIGQFRCQNVDNIPIGEKYEVEIKATAGKQKTCTPSVIRNGNLGSLGWRTWGTTLSPKCEAPTP